MFLFPFLHLLHLHRRNELPARQLLADRWLPAARQLLAVRWLPVARQLLAARRLLAVDPMVFAVGDSLPSALVPLVLLAVCSFVEDLRQNQLIMLQLAVG